MKKRLISIILALLLMSTATACSYITETANILFKAPDEKTENFGEYSSPQWDELLYKTANAIAVIANHTTKSIYSQATPEAVLPESSHGSSSDPFDTSGYDDFYTGGINRTYYTQWFDFTVNYVTVSYEYFDYEADTGWKFVVFNVSETNTFDEPIPMSNYDFELAAEGLAHEDTWPIEPLEGAYSMMPEEFILDINESATYDVVFVIPDDIYDIDFIYVELDNSDITHETFTVKYTLPY